MLRRRTMRGPSTGAFQTPVWTVRPCQATSRGSPTLTESRRPIRGGILASGLVMAPVPRCPRNPNPEVFTKSYWSFRYSTARVDLSFAPRRRPRPGFPGGVPDGFFLTFPDRTSFLICFALVPQRAAARSGRPTPFRPASGMATAGGTGVQKFVQFATSCAAAIGSAAIVAYAMAHMAHGLGIFSAALRDIDRVIALAFFIGTAAATALVT